VTAKNQFFHTFRGRKGDFTAFQKFKWLPLSGNVIPDLGE
jgi:hypothetical protein